LLDRLPLAGLLSHCITFACPTRIFIAADNDLCATAPRAQSFIKRSTALLLHNLSTFVSTK